MASENYEKARGKSDAVMFGGVKIVFPAFDDLPPKTLFWGTANFETDNGDEYKGVLADIPQVSFGRGAAQDFVDFAVGDPQSVWYETVKPYEDVFEDTRIIVTEFLLTDNDLLESETVLEGFLEKFSLNESDLSLSFSGISDCSRTGFPVGGRILSQRFCAAVFNKNGVLSPLTDPCGWQVAQGGNPVYCTRKRTGADGCEDHNNAHRIVAVEGLTTANVQYVSTGGIGGGGFGYGGGGECFTGATLVWMADGNYKQIRLIKKDDLVMSFDAAGNLCARQTVETFRHDVSSLRILDFGQNRIAETTGAHLFLTGDGIYRPAGDLMSGDTVRRADDSGVWADSTVRRAFPVNVETEVFNFHVDDTMVYFIVVGGMKIGVHNNKQFPGEEIYQ